MPGIGYSEQIKASSPAQMKTLADALSLLPKLVSTPAARIRYSKEDKLGEGAFGIVYRGTWGTKPLALKEASYSYVQAKGCLDDLSEAEFIESVEWEASRLAVLSHPNVVNFYGVYQDKNTNKWFLGMELCEGRSLTSYLKTKALPQAQQWQLALEIAQGLAYLHNQGVLHRDLKPDNVLLTTTTHAKLADLGTAQADILMEEKTSSVVKQGISDRRYKAPEELMAAGQGNATQSSRASDIFAYGLVLWSLVAGEKINDSLKVYSLCLMSDIKEDKLEDGKLYVELADDVIHYKVIDLSEKEESGLAGRITCQEIGMSAQALDINELKPYLPNILRITSKRGHTLPETEKYATFLATGERELIPQDCHPEFKKLLLACWQQDPSKRPGVDAVVERLYALAATFHPDPTMALLYQRNQLLLQEYRPSFAHYQSPYTLEQELQETAASYWQRKESEHFAVEKKTESTNNLESKTTDISFKESDPVSLSAQLTEFLGKKDEQVLVLIGEGGLGKSSGMYQLASDLLEKNTGSYLPILIRSGIKDWHHSNLTDGLRRTLASPAYLRQSEASLTQLKQQPLVFFLDGWDELTRDTVPANLPTQLGLRHWPNAKLIIGVRPAAFPKGQETALFGLSQKKPALLYVLPFNTEQLLSYAKGRVSLSPPEQEKLTQLLTTPSPLRDQLRNPFVLHLLMQAWPNVKDADFSTLTRFKIYEQSLRHWLCSAYASTNPYLTPAVQTVLKGTHNTLQDSFFSHAEQLASQGFKSKQVVVTLQEETSPQLSKESTPWLNLRATVEQEAVRFFTHKRSSQALSEQHRSILTLEDFIKIQNVKLNLFLENSPFKERESIIDYRHRSLFEYLMASAIFSTLAQKDITLLCDLLCSQPIQNEPVILSFFAEEYKKRPPEAQEILATTLKEAVLHSRDNPSPSAPPTSANSATLLNACDVSLISQNWSNVQLPGADLTNAILYKTNLSNADLSGSNLTRAQLFHTNFKNANLRNIQLGIRPRITLKEIITTIALHPILPHIAVAQENSILLFHKDTGEAIGLPLTGHTRDVTCLAYSPDGQSLASGSNEGTLRQWNVFTHAPQGSPLTGHTEAVTCLAYSPDGQSLASGSNDNTLRQWNALTHAPQGSPLTGHTQWVTCLAYSPDGRSLASGSDDCTIRQWNALTHAPQGSPLTGHTFGVTCLAYSPDGRSLVSGSNDNTLRQWNALTHAPQGSPLTGHTDSVTCLAYSPDGRSLASGSKDNTIRQWNVLTQAPQGSLLTGHTRGVLCLAYSPDGLTLASGSHDCTLRRWNALTHALQGSPLTGHTEGVNCLAYSPDSLSLVSGSDDCTLRQWNAQTGQPLRVITWDFPIVSLSIRKTPKEKEAGDITLAIGTAKGTISFWHISKEKGFRLTGYPKHPHHSLTAQGSSFQGAQMEPATRRVLEQHEGLFEAEEKATEPGIK